MAVALIQIQDYFEQKFDYASSNGSTDVIHSFHNQLKETISAKSHDSFFTYPINLSYFGLIIRLEGLDDRLPN